MPTRSVTVTFSGRTRAALDAFFAGIDRGFNAMSEDGLAETGLRRDEVPRHVFRDLFHP